MATLEDRLRLTVARARTAAGLSLSDLAATTGVSTSTLSRIETGDRRITVDLLETLADSLGSTPAALLAEASREDRLLLPTPTIQLDGGMTGVVLRVEDDGRQLLRITMPERTTLPTGRTHPGTEWFHVLRGRVQLRLGNREVVLEPGQTVQFATDQPHAMSGLGGEAEVLSRFEPGAHR